MTHNEVAPLVRRATASDLDTVVDLRAEMFAAMGADVSGVEWRANARAWFAERLDHHDCYLAVVEVAGEVVSCALGAIREAVPSPRVPQGRDILISNVCTRAAARGQGFARAATTAVMQWAASTGVHRLELMATADGKHLYEQFGFREVAFPAMRMDLGE